jgi:hypothetical protein
LTVRDPPPPGTGAEPGEQGPDEHGPYLAAKIAVEGDEVTDPERESEHPLTNRDEGKDAVDEMGGQIGHATGSAGRTETAPLAGKSDQDVPSTGRAVDAGKPVSKDAAGEEVPELADHEERESRTGRIGIDPGEKGLQILGENAIENGSLRSSAAVGGTGGARRSLEPHGIR